MPSGRSAEWGEGRREIFKFINIMHVQSIIVRWAGDHVYTTTLFNLYLLEIKDEDLMGGEFASPTIGSCILSRKKVERDSKKFLKIDDVGYLRK